MAQGNFHEDFGRGRVAGPGSERSFGLVFAVVFAAVGVWPLVARGAVRPWALALAGAMLVAALAAPRVLRPLNLAWFRLGMLLHAVTTPVVLAGIFFGIVTPLGWVLRRLGKTPFALAFDPAVRSYWIPRRPPGPAGETMRRQF